MKAKLALLAFAGVVVAVPAVWLAAHQPPHRPTEPGAVLTFIVGASLLGSGLGSWRARPDNRLGPVMALTAFAWFAGQLSEASSPAVYTIGTAVQYLFIAGFVYVLLSFPSGVLAGRLDRALVGSAVALALGLQVAAMLWGDKSGLRCSASCPDNLLQVFADNRRALRLLDLQRLLGGALTVTVVSVQVSRWLRGGAAQRRAQAPVLVAGCLTLAALTATIVDDLVGGPLGSLPADVFFYAAATVPVAVLLVFLQRRLAWGMVAGLVVQLGEPNVPVDLREALGRALGDPSLELAFWYPAEARYVDDEGRPVELPGPKSGRRSTLVERDGEPIAVLVHDPVLEHNAELVRSVCAAASLALENQRLQAELRARLVELQASRGPPRRGDRCRAAADRAQPSRRHPAAAGLDRDVPRPAPSEAAGRRRGGGAVGRRDPPGARVGFTGTTRADPRHPPAPPHRAGPACGAGRTLPPSGAPNPARRRA